MMQTRERLHDNNLSLNVCDPSIASRYRVSFKNLS